MRWTHVKVGDALSAWAPVLPDVPILAEALLLADTADFGARDALIVAVVPLADVLGDLYASTAADGAPIPLAVSLPRKRLRQIEVQELESALSTLARRDVTGEVCQLQQRRKGGLA